MVIIGMASHLNRAWAQSLAKSIQACLKEEITSTDLQEQMVKRKEITNMPNPKQELPYL